MASGEVCRIKWLQNSPFGGYVQNDELIIFFSQDLLGALNFSVTLNGGLITSGYSIPPTFTSGGQNQNYYKQETNPASYPIICNIAAAQIRLRRHIYYPWIEIDSIFENSPACNTGTPIVCDLAFNGLPQVISATGATIADGQFTVQAQSTNGPIQYKINGDFVYNDGTGQSTGTFLSKAPGTYIVYARDSINCSAQTQIILGYDETFGVLYRGDYHDRLGNISRVEILKRPHTGAVTTVSFGGMPLQFSLRGEGDDDIFKPIISTEVMVTLKATTSGMFSDLYTNNPERFRVRWSKKIEDGSFNTLWEGKLLPNQYTEPILIVPYDVSLTATDDLPQLKDVLFVQGEIPVTNLIYLNLRFTGQIKQIKLLAYALQKLRFGYNIRVACNLYATTMNQTATDDPFDQAYVNSDLYYINQEEVPSVEFVIKSILEPYGCRIILWQNIWYVLRIEEMGAAYDYREFNSNGDYVSNGTTDPILFIKKATLTNRFVWQDRSQVTNMMPGYGIIKIIYKLGLTNNILRNGNFRLKENLTGGFPEPDLYGWQLVANGENPTVSFEGLKGINVALKISNATGESYLVSNPVTVKNSGFERLHFKIRYKTPQHHINLKYQKVKVRINFGSWYLKADGSWTNSTNEFAFYQSTYGQYVENEILAFPLSNYTSAATGSFQVRVYHSYILDAEFTDLTAFKAKATTTLPTGTRTEYLLSSTMSYYELENNTSSPDDVNIVRPNDYNSSTNPYQWILKIRQGFPSSFGAEFYIDSIIVDVQTTSGNKATEEKLITYFGEQQNRNKLEKEISMGSFVDDVGGENYYNARLFYSGYLSNASGVEFVNWKRDAITESKPLHDIQLTQLSAQHGVARKRVTGTLYSDDTYLTPISCLRDTVDDDKKYILMGMTINDKENSYQVEMLEKAEVGDNTTPGYAFSLGFSLGYNS
ncbi:MAG: hypothetical protein WAZ98_03865 [Cyclobacteriaceae bacterium]